MNQQLTFRTATLPRPIVERPAGEVEQASPRRPRRRRVKVVAAALATLGAAGAFVLASRSDTQPVPAPAVVAPAVGPNADLPSDPTCQRSTLDPSCSAPVVADAGVPPAVGPNADLPADFTCRRSPLHASCVSPGGD